MIYIQQRLAEIIIEHAVSNSIIRAEINSDRVGIVQEAHVFSGEWSLNERLVFNLVGKGKG